MARRAQEDFLHRFGSAQSGRIFFYRSGVQPDRARSARLIAVVKNIVRVLDTHTEQNGLGVAARPKLLPNRRWIVDAGWHLSVRVDRCSYEPFDKLERIIERLGPPQPYATPIRAVAKASVIDPGDARIRAQEMPHRPSVLGTMIRAQRKEIEGDFASVFRSRQTPYRRKVGRCEARPSAAATAQGYHLHSHSDKLSRRQLGSLEKKVLKDPKTGDQHDKCRRHHRR